jgi:hypothetical protein
MVHGVRVKDPTPYCECAWHVELPLLLLLLLPGLMVMAWCMLCASKTVPQATATDGCQPADWHR